MIENLVKIARPLLATIINQSCPSVTNIISFDHFHRNIYKAVCLHLLFYYGVDVTMVATEVNKFEQIFPVHSRRKYGDMG
jgi:hypothetical protein